MSEEINLSLFTIAGLAHRCRQETDLFFQYLENDERFCFELFRRAIMYKNEHAWNLVVQQYSYQVAAWIKRNEFYAMADESIDYFTNQAFTNFWRAFSRDVHKLEKFSSLKALLRYLQLCAHTAVKEYVTRRTNPSLVTRSRYLRPEADESTNPASRVEEHGRAEYIWQCVLEKIKWETSSFMAFSY